MSSLLRFNAASTARNRPLTGDTKSSFVLDDHLGWLKCDGRALDKVTFNLLFQVIGYQFGGSGNNFNLPDLQGRVMGNTGFVSDQNNHTRTFAPGESVGELDHKLIQSEMPSHNHDVDGLQSNAPPVTGSGNTSSYTHNHGGNTGNSGSAAESETVVATVIASHSDASVAGSSSHNHSIASDTHSHTIRSNGGDDYHNNIQPTLFYGNTFIYSGVPITKNHAFLFPFTTGRNPVLI